MRLLCVGDVVGGPGRRVLLENLPRLRAERAVDCVIANVENVASGSGLTPTLYRKLVDGGVHLMTLGDHVFRRREVIAVLESSDRLVRPANLAPAAPGREFAIHETPAGQRVAVVTLLGRLFMRMQADCPFRAIDRVLGQIPRDVHAIVVDMHAEATSEKIALGWHLDGRVSLVFGTHTHVATADECILPRGTGYITDLGMTGPHDSVLGRDKESVLSALLTSVPTPFGVATGQPRLCGIVAEVDDKTRRTVSIERIRLDGAEPADPHHTD